MRIRKTGLVAVLSGLLMVTALEAQNPRPKNTLRDIRRQQDAVKVSLGKPAPRIPRPFQGFRVRPSAPLRFLASGEGRGYLEAIGHPLAPYLSRAFGANAEAPVAPPSFTLPQPANAPGNVSAPAATAPCVGNFGARFNLEPRANAVAQNQASADFILGGAGSGSDLVVQAANDWRGLLNPPVQWDGSASGYYVHRSTTPDCSTQFEGGLPSITFQGGAQLGIGDPVVAADPARRAFFMADLRFGTLTGVGVFRASAATLLNPALCPAGTHSEAQAESCWMATPPAFVFAQPVTDLSGDQPRIAVDERPDGAGTGAGDVYVAATEFDFNTQTSNTFLVACTNSLQCGARVLISGADNATGFPYVQVRPDGLVTTTYVEVNADGSDSIRFVACTPSGAPQQPACGAPVTAATVADPITFTGLTGDLVNLNFPFAATYPKHAHRLESGNAFTTFLVFEDCKDLFVQGHGNPNVCLTAEVVMTTSVDNGNTWSSPVVVDTAAGHHFFPAISTDASTGTVNLAYYSTEGDKFKHNARVLFSQIAPGGTAPGTPQVLTRLDPVDRDPADFGAFLTDGFLGVIARGTGSPGASRMYVSFDSTAVPGTYGGKPLAEQNNHIGRLVY